MSMIPAPALSVNIFVTNFKPVLYYTPTAPSSRPASPRPYTLDVADSPTQRSSPFALGANDSDNYIVDLTAYTGTYGDEEPASLDLGVRENYTLDLTNFDGECDSALLGEEVLSRRVGTAGMVRRAKSRTAKDALGSHGPGGRDTNRNSWQYPGALTEGPTFNPAECDLGTAQAISSKVSGYLTQGPQASSRPLPYPQSSPPHSPLRVDTFGIHRPHSAVFADWDAASDAASVRALLPEVGKGAHGEEVSLVMDQRELHDVGVVSEYARPGKPKLDRILADEVQHSDGSIIVACQ